MRLAPRNAHAARSFALGRVGLFWQATPAKFFAEWVKDPVGLQRVTHEVWQMRKLDLAKLEKAFAGK